jgi:hypothetical protein
VKQNRRFKHKFIQIQSSDFTKIYVGEKIASSTNSAGKTGCLHAEN